MTSPAATLRQTLATFLAATLDLDPVLPAPPATATAGMAFIRPVEPYIDFTADDPRSTFCAPVCNLQLVIMAPTLDWANAWEWIDEHLVGIRQQLRAGTWPGPGRHPTITTIGTPGLMQDTQLLAVEVNFASIPLKDFP